MVAPNPVQLVRLSPTGAEIGNPPALVGGGDSVIPGRLWTAQGTTNNLIQTPNPSADVPGLEAVPVDMRVGYKYDCEVDGLFFGTTGTVQLILLGSYNAGPYGTIFSSPAHIPSGNTNCARLHVVGITGPYDHLKVQAFNSAGAQVTCQYLPSLTALKIREYSTSS